MMANVNRTADKIDLPTGVVYDDVFSIHDTGRGHPESPKRYEAVKDALLNADFATSLQQFGMV